MIAMKLKNTFILHETGAETLLVPTGNAGFSGIVRGNRTLGAILKLLKEDTTQEKITEAMTRQYDAPRETIVRDVERAVAQLREIGALDE